MPPDNVTEIRTTPADVDAAEAAKNAAVEGAAIDPRPASPFKPSEEELAGNKMGAELVHMQVALNSHGLSVADLLRSVAKNFHGVTIPVFQPEED